jgi:hypothetical protein
MAPEKKERPQKEKKKGSSKASSSGSAEGPLLQLRPSQILYTYSKVLPYFSGCGRTLEGTLAEIESGAMKACDLPAIAVISADVPVGPVPKNGDADQGKDDGWSSEEDGRKGKKGRKKSGGGGGKSGRKSTQTTETKFFSTNNRRLWVLKQCERRGLLGEEGTIGVRLQRPEVSKRMVEKGTRSFRIERASDDVKIVDVEAPPPRAGARKKTDEDDWTAGDLPAELEMDRETTRGTTCDGAVNQVNEALEDFHPVLRPYH